MNSWIFKLLDRGIVFFGFIVTLTMVAHFGFHLPEATSESLALFNLVLALLFAGQEILRMRECWNYREYLQERWYEAGLLALFFLLLLAQAFWVDPIHRDSIWIGGFGLILLFGMFSSAVNRFEKKVTVSKVRLRPAQVFLLSFGVPIVIGACLLKLPKAAHFDMSWVDAFFMATSAICVTGLGVFDLNQLTGLGQGVLLALIQIGGLGIMTMSLAFAGIISGGLGVKDRLMLSEMFSGERLSEVKSLLARIFILTFTIEAIGAAILYFSSLAMADSHGSAVQTVFSAIFHSVSAFCNAGFSLLPENMMAPIFRDNLIYMFVVMTLIVLGGLGFPVLVNIFRWLKSRWGIQKQKRALSLSTKVVLVSTFFLLVSGVALFYFLESQKGFSQLTGFGKFFHGLFLSVTARTAGFNAWPMDQISEVSIFVLLFLMWIGGAPMSTAGGIKVTTFFVGLYNLKSFISGQERLEVFGREISEVTVKRAFAIVFVSLGFIFFSSLLLIYLEPEKDPMGLVFEVVSAVSTVGLSKVQTGTLSDPSKVVVALLMFIGRVGVLTVLAAFVRPPKSVRYQLLKDDVMVG